VCAKGLGTVKHLFVILAALHLACSIGINPVSSTGAQDSGPDHAVCLDQAAVIAAVGQDSVACNALPGQSIELGADAGTCDQRITHACTADCVGSTLDSQMRDLVRICGDLSPESRLGIIFSNGCAVRIVSDITGSNPAALTACLIEHLDVIHYACADVIPCWNTEYSLIAAN
jgi:hypothetical protein